MLLTDLDVVGFPLTLLPRWVEVFRYLQVEAAVTWILLLRCDEERVEPDGSS